MRERYVADHTSQWGSVIRDMSDMHTRAVAKGDAPVKEGAIVVAFIRPALVQTLVDALNAKETPDA